MSWYIEKFHVTPIFEYDQNIREHDCDIDGDVVHCSDADYYEQDIMMSLVNPVQGGGEE